MVRKYGYWERGRECYTHSQVLISLRRPVVGTKQARTVEPEHHPRSRNLEAEALMQGSLVPTGGAQKPQRVFPKLVGIILLALVYFIAGKFGLGLAIVNPSASAVWPPTGIALAALLLLGMDVWPGILLGAFLVNVTTSGSVPVALAIAAGNTLEGVLGAYLIDRYAHGRQAFLHVQDVFKFAFLTIFLCTPVSATIGATSLVWAGLAPPADYLPVWLTWWLGDIAGALILAPVLILWTTSPRTRWNVARVLEALLLLFSLILLGMLVFGSQSPFAVKKYPLEFVFMPLIIWAALRFGPREAATLTVILSGIAIMGSLQGFGPFARALPNGSLLLLQGFMGMVAITGLSLAALVSERQSVEAALRDMNEKLKFSLSELEQHNLNINLLNEMGDLLQSCSDINEAYSIIGQVGRQLFTEEDGGLYIINNSQNMVEAAAVWGPSPPEMNSFGLDDCWALRRGRTHILNNGGVKLLCPHLKSHPPLASICIPMMAQGETMGILHIQTSGKGSDLPDPAGAHLIENWQQLAQAMADRTALALANVRLRISLRQQSIRDPLTELFNRRYLEETLERELRRATRLQRPVGVVMMDLDHFKSFNDRFGHEAGDLLLRELGKLLKKHIRGGDVACRYGGEEFALILPDISLQDAQERAEQLREEIKAMNINYREQALEAITLSLGVAMFPDHGDTGILLLRAADTALYEAKRLGRDRVIVAPLSPAEQPVAE
jgi:diguanylate cyclase (GGDEF)-like protein